MVPAPVVLLKSAPVRYRSPLTASFLEGVEVEMPTDPLFKIERADGDEVAKLSDEVPMYRFPPMEEKSQCLVLAEADMSESAKNVLVDEAICRFHCGVDVPRPILLPFSNNWELTNTVPVHLGI